MAWVAICERATPNMGRNLNQTYVNVARSTRLLSYDSAADFVAANPGHPWADPLFNEFIVDLTDQEAQDINDGTNPLNNEGVSSQPRWQNETDGSAEPKAFGSFADPTDDQSVFTLDVPLPDTRFRVRIWDGDPFQGPAKNHLAFDEFDEAADTVVDRFLALYDPDDGVVTTNAANQRTEIGGKLMDFDFGTSNSPPLSAGVAKFGVNIAVAGRGVFPSNHQYKIVGPADEREYLYMVFGKSLEVEE